MSIEGISNIIQVPILGKVRLGLPKAAGPGQATSCFQLRSEDGCDPLRQVFGEKPMSLRIMFPCEDPQVFAPQFLQCYKGSQSLVCEGTGSICTRTKIDTETGALASHTTREWEWQHGMSCNPDECPEYQEKNCRRVMKLMFIVPEAPGLGVWRLSSSSYHNIVSVNSICFALKQMMGRCSMLPLTMSLVQKEVTPMGQKKKNVWVLRFDIEGKISDLAQKAIQAPVQALMLPQGEDDAPEDLEPTDTAGWQNPAEVSGVPSVTVQKPPDVSGGVPSVTVQKPPTEEKKGRGRPRKDTLAQGHPTGEPPLAVTTPEFLALRDRVKAQGFTKDEFVKMFPNFRLLMYSSGKELFAEAEKLFQAAIVKKAQPADPLANLDF